MNLSAIPDDCYRIVAVQAEAGAVDADPRGIESIDSDGAPVDMANQARLPGLAACNSLHVHFDSVPAWVIPAVGGEPEVRGMPDPAVLEQPADHPVVFRRGVGMRQIIGDAKGVGDVLALQPRFDTAHVVKGAILPTAPQAHCEMLSVAGEVTEGLIAAYESGRVAQWRRPGRRGGRKRAFP